MDKIKSFLNRLLDQNDPTSSKRFAGLSCLSIVILLSIVTTIYSGGKCPEFMFNSLLIYSGSCFGLNAVEKIFKKDSTVETDK